MKKLTLTFIILVTTSLTACGDGDGGNSNGGSNSGGNGNLTNLTPNRSLAFPGADGGARTITGGTGGDIYIVNSLEDDEGGLIQGTLRHALKNGNRTIVFAIGGQINLVQKLNISKSNITIAGQSAPGGGITIAGYPVFINGSNICLRFLRFRMGNQNIEKANFVADDGDALGGKDCKDILIDHCSISWSTDECASFSRIENFTLQYCIISESLKLAGHSKGNHGYGGIWGGKNASYHHNLVADHDSRNPRFDHSYVGRAYLGPIDYENNVVYNWGGNSTYGGEAANVNNPFHINFVNNYYKAGPSSSQSSKNRLMQLTTHCTNCVSNTGEAFPAMIYLDGNLINGENGSWDNVTMDGSETRDKTALKENARLSNRWTTGLTALQFVESANEAYNSVLSYAGASKVRDAVDERIINQVKNGTGAIINSVSDTPGYPTLSQGTAITDTDNDGMPDAWEQQQMNSLGVTGKTVSEFLPGAYNLSAKYTNLEVYLNELVANTFPAGANASATR